MKKLWKISWFILALIVTVGLVSCHNDSDEPPKLIIKNGLKVNIHVYLDDTEIMPLVTEGQTTDPYEVSKGTHTVTVCQEGITPPDERCALDTRDYPNNFEYTIQISEGILPTPYSP